jgi:exopolyphosphatase/guanosine-5'-triphosphate,3'-diphosphate pyrophosphatase
VTRRAAVDIGTNTVRLLVADVRSPDVPPAAVLRDLEITRLGQGVDAQRRLDPEAGRRTLEAVARFVEAARSAGAWNVRVAGTSVLRDAADRDAFAAAVRERTGVELEVLTGDQEGSLAFRGATLGISPGPFVVCDIGGGSTELVREGAAWSLDVGSVRLRERCLRSDPPLEAEIASAAAVVDACLDAVALEGSETLVGVAGTITTLAALHLGLERYDHDRVHGTRLPAADVRRWAERLLAMRVEEVRQAFPIVPAGRADVIGAGVLILREVMDRWGYGEVVSSERDILDGLVLDAERRAGGAFG